MISSTAKVYKRNYRNRGQQRLRRKHFDRDHDGVTNKSDSNNDTIRAGGEELQGKLAIGLAIGESSARRHKSDSDNDTIILSEEKLQSKLVSWRKGPSGDLQIDWKITGLVKP